MLELEYVRLEIEPAPGRKTRNRVKCKICVSASWPDELLNWIAQELDLGRMHQELYGLVPYERRDGQWIKRLVAEDSQEG